MSLPTIPNFKKRVVTATCTDIGAASDTAVVAPFRGAITKIEMVNYTTVSGGAAAMSFSTITSTGGTKTITGSISITTTTAITPWSVIPTGDVSVAQGDVLIATSDGGPTSATGASVSWHIREY